MIIANVPDPWPKMNPYGSSSSDGAGGRWPVAIALIWPIRASSWATPEFASELAAAK